MKPTGKMGKKFLAESKKTIRQQWKEFSMSQYINHPKIKAITLVGSRATGTARRSSDADFKILIDRLPTRLHINPKTGEKTKLPTGRDMATVDFSNFMRGVTMCGIAIDPFIVFSKHESDYLSPHGVKRT